MWPSNNTPWTAAAGAGPPARVRLISFELPPKCCQTVVDARIEQKSTCVSQAFRERRKKAKSACVCDKNSIFSEEQAENHHNHQLVSNGAILFSFFLPFSWGESWQTRKMGRKKLNTLSIQHFCVVLFGEGAVFLRSMESRRKGRRRRCIQSWYLFIYFWCGEVRRGWELGRRWL